MVHVLFKPSLENFEHYFASVWNECNCAVVWTFLGIALLWDLNENWLSPGGLPNPGIELWSPVLQADSLPSEPNKAMLKILQARLQPYVNRELPDTQVGFRKGRGIRDQIANTGWIIEKAKEFQKNIYFCLTD